MNRAILGVGFLAAATVFPHLAAAADFEPPPLRPVTYDWSGPYVGGKAGIRFGEGHYKVTCSNCTPHDPEMNGHGWGGGPLLGYNYQWNQFVLGVEGDWGFGGRVARNREPAERTKVSIRNMPTIRGRLGWAFDDTMIYGTGGVAFADTKFSTDDMPMGSGLSASHKKWKTGWIVGGGVEHAFTDRITGRLEYTYADFGSSTYDLRNSGGAAKVRHRFKGVHSINVGLAYNFGWW